MGLLAEFRANRRRVADDEAAQTRKAWAEYSQILLRTEPKAKDVARLTVLAHEFGLAVGDVEVHRAAILEHAEVKRAADGLEGAEIAAAKVKGRLDALNAESVEITARVGKAAQELRGHDRKIVACEAKAKAAEKIRLQYPGLFGGIGTDELTMPASQRIQEARRQADEPSPVGLTMAAG